METLALPSPKLKSFPSNIGKGYKTEKWGARAKAIFNKLLSLEADGKSPELWLPAAAGEKPSTMMIAFYGGRDYLIMTDQSEEKYWMNLGIRTTLRKVVDKAKGLHGLIFYLTPGDALDVARTGPIPANLRNLVNLEKPSLIQEAQDRAATETMTTTGNWLAELEQFIEGGQDGETKRWCGLKVDGLKEIVENLLPDNFVYGYDEKDYILTVHIMNAAEQGKVGAAERAAAPAISQSVTDFLLPKA